MTGSDVLAVECWPPPGNNAETQWEMTMHEPVQPAALPRFHVSVTRVSGLLARAEAHGQTLELAIKGGDPTLGFTAPETLLAAFGACILSNVTRNAAEMGLRIDHAEVTFDGVKHVDPLGIDPLRYRLILYSPEPAEALRALYRRATSDGTATNAILNGLDPAGELTIEPSGAPRPEGSRQHTESCTDGVSTMDAYGD